MKIITTEYTFPGIVSLSDHVGETVEIPGVIYKIRRMSGFAFVILQTPGGDLQCVYEKERASFGIDELSDGMSVTVTGFLSADKRSKIGAELKLLSYKALSVPAEPSPIVINNKELVTSQESLFDFRAVTLRNAKERAVFKIQAGLSRGLRSFLDHNNFTEIHTPKLVSGSAEGGANMFKLDYFGKEAMLAQSPQLYKQIMVGVFGRVYEIAPVFRAEKHDTSRHMNEYTSVDIELGFINSYRDLMQIETRMLFEAFSILKNEYETELKLLNVNLPLQEEIPAIDFREAKELISRSFNRQITDSMDFEPEEEKLLCEIVKKKRNSDFVFVTGYRAAKRPFYTMNSPENTEITESFDLLFRGMEITTGGQRIHDYNEQVKKIQSLNIAPQPFESYLCAHKHGLPPYGGFGLGLERLTAKLLNFDNVRRGTLFPRDTNRLTP